MAGKAVTVSDFAAVLNDFANFSDTTLEDNSGLLVGDPNRVVSGAVFCLDVTHGVLDRAKKAGANLLVSHHPIIFDPIRKITAGDVIYRAVREDIAVICCHLPVDERIGGANLWLCEKLGLLSPSPALAAVSAGGARLCNAYVGRLAQPQSCDAFALAVSRALDFPVRYTKGRDISTVAVCGGAGRSLMEEIFSLETDCIVTGEVSHHHCIAAEAAGVTLIDGSHFATEIHIPLRLLEICRAAFSELPLVLARESNPFAACEYRHTEA